MGLATPLALSSTLSPNQRQRQRWTHLSKPMTMAPLAMAWAKRLPLPSQPLAQLFLPLAMPLAMPLVMPLAMPLGLLALPLALALAMPLFLIRFLHSHEKNMSLQLGKTKKKTSLRLRKLRPAGLRRTTVR